MLHGVTRGKLDSLVCGPSDYLEEHKKRKLKKEKEVEAKYQGEGWGMHGSGHGGSVKDGQFMG